jgi:signal transduction histidine kinase
LFDDSLTSEVFYNIEFNGKKIRQGQFPIINKAGKLTGQLVIGISQVESALILTNLRLTFFIAFPLMLLIFYFVTSLAVSRSIAPVKKLIQFAGTIHYNNINNRLPLPPNQDEIHQLTTTINDLLERIEIGLNREKQITADISHELRTPLTSIRGTLEVLVRKTREPNQYEEKVHQVIQEVDSMNHIIDQLLHLARIDSGNLSIVKTSVYLNELLLKIKHRWLFRLNEKSMSMHIDVPNDVVVNTDSGLLEIMLGNIISNACKYGHINGSITCKWDDTEKRLSIIDNGPGIPQEHLPNLFKRFYRTDTSENSKIQGIGLGLYIVKTLSGLQEITINVESEINQGSNFSLQFKH